LGEEKEATAVAEPTTPEVTLESIQQELASTKEVLATAKADLEQAQHKAKAEEQNVSKKERQLQEVRTQQTEVKDLKKTVDVLTTMVADLVDRGDFEDEPAKRKRSEEYLSKLKTEAPKEPSLPSDFIEAANEADKLAKSVGLDVEESDELAKAYRYFMKRDGDKGLEEVKRVVDGVRKAKEETPKKNELTEEEEEEIARKYLEKKGQLHTDAGTPSGKGMSKSEAWAKYASGGMSDADAKKHGLF